MDIVTSVNGVQIRMTDERWVHIVENHDDLAGYYDEILATIENPDYVILGYGDSFIALKKQVTKKKYLAVIYKEIVRKDGFIITAFFTSRIKLEQEVIVWKSQQ